MTSTRLSPFKSIKV